jgi:hypothetical protein
MTKQEHQTKKGDRVRLKGQGQDALYEAAYAGAEGYVRRHRHDELGYPEIFVAWDKTHWTYNGEKDGWTMESHFDIVEDDDMDSQDNKHQDLVRQMAEQLGYDLVPKDEQKENFGTDLDAEYDRIATAALEAISDGTAFVLLTVRDGDSSEGPAKITEVFNGYRDEVSQYLVEANVSRIGAKAHERVISKVLYDIMEGGGK